MGGGVATGAVVEPGPGGEAAGAWDGTMLPTSCAILWNQSATSPSASYPPLNLGCRLSAEAFANTMANDKDRILMVLSFLCLPMEGE